MFQFDRARRGVLSVVSLAILLLASHVYGDSRPNVILVMADDMGWAQTGYYGYPHMKTPNLDDMAKNGLDKWFKQKWVNIVGLVVRII